MSNDSSLFKRASESADDAFGGFASWIRENPHPMYRIFRKGMHGTHLVAEECTADAAKSRSDAITSESGDECIVLFKGEAVYSSSRGDEEEGGLTHGSE